MADEGPADPLVIDALTRLCAAGATWPDIGAALRLPPRSAEHLAAQEGLDLIRRQARERRRLLIDAVIEADRGETPAARLAAQLGVDEAAVRRRRQQIRARQEAGT